MGAVRLFLAISVAFAHFNANTLVPNGMTSSGTWVLNFAGARAVIFFYIVSGFLISFVLDEKYGTTLKGAVAFYRARFLRIYPLWWAALAFAILVIGSRLSLGNFALSAGLFGVDWLAVFHSYPVGYLGMLPDPLGVGWTLGAELTFYLIAPLISRSTATAIGLFVGSVLLRIVLDRLFPLGLYLHGLWNYFFFPATLMFFLLGHFAQRINRRFAIGLAPSLLLLAVAAFLSEIDLTPTVDRWPAHLATVAFALALPGFFAATKDSRPLNFLGDLTYPLYLMHGLTLVTLLTIPSMSWIVPRLVTFAKAAGTPIEQGAVMMGFLLAISLIVAAATHFVVEIPMRKTVARVVDAGLHLARSRAAALPPRAASEKIGT